MGDAVLGVLFLIVTFVGVYLYLAARRRRYLKACTPWSVTTHAGPDNTLKVCCERGTECWVIGQLNKDLKFELLRLRLEAKEACDDLNAKL